MTTQETSAIAVVVDGEPRLRIWQADDQHVMLEFKLRRTQLLLLAEQALSAYNEVSRDGT